MQNEDLKKTFSRHIAKVMDYLEISQADKRLLSLVKGQLWELHDDVKQSRGESHDEDTHNTPEYR